LIRTEICKTACVNLIKSMPTIIYLGESPPQMALVLNSIEGYVLNRTALTISFCSLFSFPLEKIDQPLHLLCLVFSFSAGNGRRTFRFAAIAVGPIVLPQAADHVGRRRRRRRRRRPHVGLSLGYRQAVLLHDPGTILGRPGVHVPELPLLGNRDSRPTSVDGLRRLIGPSPAGTGPPIDTGVTQPLQFGEEVKVVQGLVHRGTCVHVPYHTRLFLAVKIIALEDNIRERQWLSGSLGAKVEQHEIFFLRLEPETRWRSIRSHTNNF